MTLNTMQFQLLPIALILMNQKTCIQSGMKLFLSDLVQFEQVKKVLEQAFE